VPSTRLEALLSYANVSLATGRKCLKTSSDWKRSVPIAPAAKSLISHWFYEPEGRMFESRRAHHVLHDISHGAAGALYKESEPGAGETPGSKLPSGHSEVAARGEWRSLI
jgi:hypothetical protein